MTPIHDVETRAADLRGLLHRHPAQARQVLRLVLAREDISSQLIDNLNASIHLRALLTDLFVVDEVLKPKKGP